VALALLLSSVVVVQFVLSLACGGGGSIRVLHADNAMEPGVGLCPPEEGTVVDNFRWRWLQGFQQINPFLEILIQPWTMVQTVVRGLRTADRLGGLVQSRSVRSGQSATFRPDRGNTTCWHVTFLFLSRKRACTALVEM
jgi:hypothetical protein